MSASGDRGILKAHKKRPGVVTIKEFHSAQVVPAMPLHKENAKPHAGSLLNYSARVVRSRFVSDRVNAQRADLRAAMLQCAVIGRAETVWFTLDDIRAAEAQEERQPSPAPQLSLPNKEGKVVRFADKADIEQFDFVATEQCELGSAHELCLKTFLSRVEHAHNFSHEFNEKEARDIALRARDEVKMQQEEVEEEGKTAAIESFFVDQASGFDEGSEGQRKPTKKCFWILDARCMPQHASRNSEGRR
eukprot:TRINITY_DN9909_c0_g3_i1.p1 TRINITY_DN9909_c0_g3~~TRINITY_DN9909_c0_g3_i1.p1  ORF type:complete len:247 (-),score=52.17 TRINITY_DN9909_c0_g3_i1:112-852(-)